MPAFFSVRNAPATFATRAIGMCAVAPAADLRTVALTPAARRSGITTAVAPAHSAERMIAPALCGSVMWSSTTYRAVARFAQCDRFFDRHVRERRSERDDALMRAIRKLREERTALEADREARRLRTIDQLRERGIAFAFVADVYAAQRITRAERFFYCVHAVDHVVERRRLSLRDEGRLEPKPPTVHVF